MDRGTGSSVARFWTDRPLASKGLIVVAVPLAILLGSLVSLYLASVAEERAEDDVRRAFAIQRDTYQVHALLAEAAAGVRGFALTREERFLQPYRRAEQDLPATMQRLDGSIRDPVVRGIFDELRGLTARKRQGLRQIVELAGRGRPASDAAMLQDSLTSNKRVLDAMRSRIDEIQQREAVLLAQRSARVDEVRRRYLILTGVSALIGLLGSLAAVYLFSTGIVRRVRALEDNAERLARGETLAELPDEADEVGRLSKRIARASSLLRAREQDLRDSEERFRLVVDRVSDYGIFALDPDGTVATWNLGAERIKGWQASEILGQHFKVFYPPETRDSVPVQMLERARRDGSAEDEGWRLRKDGSRFWANVVITALRGEDATLRGFAKVTRDITDRRRSEEVLRHAREEAVAANRAKSEFLSRTSHELRTPLNAILGFGQLLEIDDDTFAEQHRTAIQQIVKAGRHLLSLINDLLDISSIEAGGAELSLASVDVGEMLREVHALALPVVGAAGLAFLVEEPPQPVSAMTDRRRATQVMLNLVANAAKYAGGGSQVVLRCCLAGDHIRIEVADDGPGVPSADAARLFTAFDRLGQQARGRVEGTGLGLALSKSLIESMDGAIGYEPRAPGACFWFTLPLVKTEGERRSADTD